MNKLIEDTIKRIYVHKDYNYFIEQCKDYKVPRELKEFLDSLKYSIDFLSDNCEPCLHWLINYEIVKKGEFEAKFISQLQISKIIPIFHVYHEFEVENKDDLRIEPVLDGFGCQPYNIAQAEFDTEISKILENKNYIKISYADMAEVVVDVMLPRKSIFGSQLTVENALFRDLFEILSSPCR